jgi:DNA-binding CsgD family transcriptional regulator
MDQAVVVAVELGRAVRRAGLVRRAVGDHRAHNRDRPEPPSVSEAVGGGFLAFALAIGVFGVLTVTGEYHSGLIRGTLVAVPRRLPVRSGASGFLTKDAQPAELINGIRVVAAGDAVVAPTATRRLIERFAEHLPDGQPRGQSSDPRLGDLTTREREVLVALARGHSNREIAEHLHVAEGTVKVHVSRLLTKLDLRDRAQLIVFAYENGVIRPGQHTD